MQKKFMKVEEEFSHSGFDELKISTFSIKLGLLLPAPPYHLPAPP